MKQRARPFMAELQRARADGRPAAFPDGQAQTGSLPAPSNGADHTEVLAAISDLGAKLDRFLATDHEEIDHIRVEVSDISGRIKATKVEMAALRHPLSNEDKFTQASEELSAVVSAAETATNTIIACAEELDEIVQELKAQLPEGYQASRVNDMNEAIVRIFEACNFHDLTGQRITKVVRTLSFIEERVEAMLGLWNRREMEAMPLPPSIIQDDGGLKLTGPKEQADGVESFSQADIDALFD